jgi:hypothetical protein
MILERGAFHVTLIDNELVPSIINNIDREKLVGGIDAAGQQQDANREQNT